ncbi:MAG: response regulator [Gammaproteobacteria bacterium]|nr:response regulator [Gammaproteobacteria bacterium]MCW8908998.1 response regulator [Gammaproteobacteria bacterium]MCW9006179.1 response regulator [Gammaproteobacteria bacterium]
MSELNKIMYVEDQPDIQMVAKVALESVGGFEVLICSGGEEALEKVKDFNPQLILLDVMMPGMDGPTTKTELGKLPEIAAIPVVFMTAKIQPAEVAEYKEMGALDVIPKPFDPMTLSDQIREIWNQHNL